MTRRQSALSARVRVRVVADAASLDLSAISRLMASVGMRPRKLRDLRAALGASSVVVVAFRGADIVGFGRVISDGVYYASIWDVAVTPELQRQGIGTRIMRAVLRWARRKQIYMLGLFTAISNSLFYQRLGFRFEKDIHAMRRRLRTVDRADRTLTAEAPRRSR